MGEERKKKKEKMCEILKRGKTEREETNHSKCNS
jgi:hypothetical protein